MPVGPAARRRRGPDPRCTLPAEVESTAWTAPAPLAASTRAGRGFLVVRIVLGVLLLTAAGLKLYGMNVTAVPRVGWLATPRVQLVAAEWELILGLWLLSGARQAGAWVATTSTFAAFAALSGYFGMVGV